MTQPNVADAIRRVQAEARRVATPLVTTEDEAAWERYKAYALPLLAALVTALVERRITPREFERAMLQQIRQSRYFAFAITRGGLAAITPQDRQRIDARVNGQAGYLAAWVAALVVGAGGALLLKGRAVSQAAQLARASLYLEASQAGLFEGAAARVGMAALPAYPGDGTTRCRVNCRCSWGIQQVGDADWDCWWLLGLAEHCEHCPRRALAWSPLSIRSGIIQPYIRTGLFLE